MTKLKISKSDRALIAEYGPLSNPVENTLMLRIEAATNAPLARVNNQVVDDPSKVPQGPWISTPLVDATNAPLTPSPTGNLPAIVNPPVMATYEEMAHKIQVELDAIAASEKAAFDHRLAAGRLLFEVQQRHPNFMAWCKDNVKRSRSDIYALIALVKSPDPSQASENARERARTGMRATRAANRPSVTLQTTPSAPSAAVQAEVNAINSRVEARAIIDAEFTSGPSPRAMLASALLNTQDSATTTEGSHDYAKLLRIYRELADAVKVFLTAEAN